MKAVKSIAVSGLLVVSSLSLSFPASAQIRLHFNERPPYVFSKDGQLSGLFGTPAEAAFKAEGIPYTLVLTPVARQLQIIKNNGSLDCSASAGFKNAEREEFAKFTRAVYRDKARIAVTNIRNTKLKDGDTIESVLGNKTINLLVKTGYSYGKVLDDLIEKLQPTRTVVSTENIPMMKMIQAGRADLMFISQEEADGLLAEEGINPSEIRKIHFSNAPDGEDRYIFCSKKVPDEIIDKLNRALK